jgi:hypothetical protein
MSTTTYTQAELLAEAQARFGEDPLDIAFVCPRCGDVATIREFLDAGNPNSAGQHCIGRELGALRGDRNENKGVVHGQAPRGCDWAAYGLFSGPWTVILPNGKKVPSFPLAAAAADRADTTGGAR